MIPTFTLSFRDIEDSVRQFDGSGKLPVEIWISEFEETSTIMQWNDFQKFVFAKKSLSGLAKLFIQSERGLSSWTKLRSALIDEFARKTDSAQIHRQLMERKMKKNESVFEYFFSIKEIASRGAVDESSIIQYVIDGIEDLHTNKSILYGAKNIREFKDKLACYETFREKSKSDYISRTGHQKTDKRTNLSERVVKKELVCFNCGGKGHKSIDCKDKIKGTKCFRCNQFGHTDIEELYYVE